MNHTKCLHCGLVNLSSDEVCERCGTPLDGNAMNAPALEPARPDFPGLTFRQDVSAGSRTLKVVLVVIVALALGGGAWALYKRNASSRRAANMPAVVVSIERGPIFNCEF